MQSYLNLGLFPDEARDRISHIQDTPDFNTQLSIVSIVGKRGAGKSTVASFLSGNSSMFVVSVFFVIYCHKNQRIVHLEDNNELYYEKMDSKDLHLQRRLFFLEITQQRMDENML